MKKKIFGLIICMLLIATLIPVGLSENTKKVVQLSQDNMFQTCSSENWTETQKLIASDGIAEDRFGWSVSLDGDTAIIGAVSVDSWRGAAYVFTRTGTSWTQQAKLLASDGVAGDYFGYSVSLDGDTAFIGVVWDDSARGAVYVFTRTGTTWTEQAKLLASDGAAGQGFGVSVSLYGDTAVIGADGDDLARGAAYVFTRIGTSWTQQAKLNASDSEEWDRFGISVSLYGDTAVIGAYCEGGMSSPPGFAYVFTRTGTSWTQQAKLLASDGAASDRFGWSVSLDGDTAVIGAYGDDDMGGSSGSVYVFTRTGTSWTQQAKLLASDGTNGNEFGWSVSLDSDTAVIGAFSKDTVRGAAYVFTRIGTSWTQQAKLLASDGVASDRFGISVSLYGDTAVIGAIGDDSFRGSAYVFTREGNVNQPPDTPTITGPTQGKIKVDTDYNFTATDPDTDDVYYFIDWGDQTNSSWIGPYASGEPITKSHTWPKKGDYTIKAKAKDIFGNESDWGTLSVTMPCSYNIPFQLFWERLFERFPHIFPMLRHLLGY